MRTLKAKRKIIIAVAIVLAIAIGAGTVVYMRYRDKTVVNVYSVELLNSSDWFAGDSELTGTLTSDYIQEVTIDSSKTVKKIYVKKGDQVRKGDVLLKYSMDEEELDLKLQKLQIKSSKMEIEEMEEELEKLKNTKTVGSSTDAAGSGIMQASASLSNIKGTVLSYLVSRANSSGDNESGSSGNSVSEDGSSGTDGTSDSGESGTDSNASEDSSGTGDDSGTATETEILKYSDLPTSVTDFTGYSGTGTKTDPYVFPLRKEEGTNTEISGKVLRKLSGKYAKIVVYESEEAYTKGTPVAESLILDEENGLYVKGSTSEKTSYTLSEAKDCLTSNEKEAETLCSSITDVDQKAASWSGDGTKDKPYVYLLEKGGTVKYSVISELQKDGKYAKFMEYAPQSEGEGEQKVEIEAQVVYEEDPNADPASAYTVTPDTLYENSLKSGKEYTLSTLESSERTPYDELPTTIKETSQYIDGSGTKSDPYVYYLQSGGLVKGSVLKDLIGTGKYAKFKEYTESDYSKSDYENSAKTTLEISGSTKFDPDISKQNGYELSYLKSIMEEANTPTTTDKTIQFKQSRTTVKAGKYYKFTVVDEDGNSIDQTKVKWTLSDNSSKDTLLMGKKNGVKVYGTKNGVELYVDGDESSASLTITAQAKDIEGVSSTKITRTLKVKKTNTSNNGGGNNSSSDDDDDDYSGDDGEETYTKEELEEEISEKEEEIAQAKEELHEAKISYKEAKEEVEKATVKATVNGTVTTASDTGTLPTDGSAAIVVKAADGMYVKTSVSEMDLDTIKVGGTLTCTSMETGDSYEAEVQEVSDFPSESDSSDESSNPNSSYYPIVAFIQDADGLSTGDTVEISYSSESMGTVDEGDIYLQKAYVRTEDGKSYVYKRNKKTKRLEKQYVQTGETMYGQYIEIKSGLSTDDYVAFPYGKTLRDGVKTKISEDDSEMIY